MQIVGRDKTVIATTEDWRTLCPPKGGDDHWNSGRSARELAEAWCGTTGPCVPEEIAQLLGSHPDFCDVSIERVFPERQIRFDNLRGEPRNADLAVEAHDRDGRVAITVEGKADESFDRTISAVLESATQRIARDTRTGAIDRIESLASALLPPWREGLPHLGELRYQLLTGLAGTLAWAREIDASRAIFIVHEFVTDQTRDPKHSMNAADLYAFLTRLSDGVIGSLTAGTLAGPIRVPGNSDLPSVPVYIGKAVRTTRER